MNAEAKAAADQYRKYLADLASDDDNVPTAVDYVASRIDQKTLADWAIARIAADESERVELTAIHDKLKEIVCTEGVDAGVVLLSNDGTFHNEERDGRTVSCYDNEYFSPLGDALMAIHFDLLRALGIEPKGGAT